MKVVVVGAGAVGATAAYACLLRGVGEEIVLLDVLKAKAEAQALDLLHSVQFARMARVRGTDDLADCSNADVIVLAAGAKQRPGQTRLDLAAANAQLCRTLIPTLVVRSPNAWILVVSNPVDVVTRVALEHSGLPPNRVIGSGTVLDGSRLRSLLAARCRVAVENVHAHVIGEHGDSEVALWSSASIAGIPAARWPDDLGGPLGDKERTTLLDDVRGAAYRIIAGKGATSYAIGVVATRIIEAVAHDERRVLTVSSYLRDHPVAGDVCLSMPCVLDSGGLAAVLDVPLDAAEAEALAASANAIRAAAASVGC